MVEVKIKVPSWQATRFVPGVEVPGVIYRNVNDGPRGERRERYEVPVYSGDMNSEAPKDWSPWAAPVEVKAGDWIVRDEHGHLSVHSHESFCETFDLSGGDRPINIINEGEVMRKVAREQTIENGLTIEEIAGTAGKVFLMAKNLPQPTDPRDSAADDPSWQRAAGRAVAQLNGDIDSLRWSDYAAVLYHAHTPVELGGLEVFSDLPQVENLAWQAVARHLANVIVMEDDELSKLEGHEAHWQGWAVARSGG